jgi:predicted MFS family arabinose efflux permease
LWNFSVNVPGPFFTVYLVQNLGASAVIVGVTSVAISLAALLVQRKLGILADRWGARRMQMVSGLLIPIIPVAWVLTHAARNVILINLLSGALWSAYNLGSFNYLLGIIPEEKQARFSAVYQIVVMLSLSAGAAVGGVLVTAFGYLVIFWGSGIGRLAAALLFVRFAAAPAEVRGVTELTY